VLVTQFSEETLKPSLEIAQHLRAAGLRVDLYPEFGKYGKQFKYADRIGARIALVLGPDEIASGQVTIKNLSTREQTKISRDNALEFIVEILAGN
jgi:histidyl-tRNA synthetase